MLVAGDELGRTQGGNNNAYCQDNEISWIHWEEADHQLLDFTKKLIWFCKDHPSFRRRRWFQGLPVTGSDVEDIRWYSPDGNLMSDENWEHDFAKSLGVYLNGKGIRCVNYDGRKITDDSFYIIFNAHEEALDYVLPADQCNNNWKKAIDTSDGFIGDDTEEFEPGSSIKVQGRSVLVLKCHLA